MPWLVEQGRNVRRDSTCWRRCPGPVGFVTGVVLFVLIRYGVNRAIFSTNDSYLAPMAESLNDGPLASLAWLALGICWLASVFSVVAHKHERRPPRRDKSDSVRRSARVEPSQSETRAPVSRGLEPQPFVHDQESLSQTCSEDTNRPAPVTTENIANLSWLQFEQLIAAIIGVSLAFCRFVQAAVIYLRLGAKGKT